MIPNGTNITACAKYNLKLPNVSEQASATDVLPTFKHSLIFCWPIMRRRLHRHIFQTWLHRIQQKQETGSHWEPQSNNRTIRAGHNQTKE